MPCFGPIIGYRSKVIGASGKRGITFDRNLSHSGVAIKLPCGRCHGCRLERSRQWAMRCMNEKRMHSEACFLTLTYDNKFLPPGGTLVLRDLQLFMKRLRKSMGAGIRFYACGEYGDKNLRPHYHVLIFNKDFSDKVWIEDSSSGPLYVSAALAKLWPVGIHRIGEVTFHSCAYVARYIMKKLSGASIEQYQVVDGDGVVYERLPEFSTKSNRPGIGMSWYVKYGRETFSHDSLIMNGREVKPPRFYLLRLEASCPWRVDVLKKERLRVARLFRADNTSARLRVRERLAIKTMAQYRRSV